MTMTSARYLSQGLSILSTLSTPLHYIIDASDSASLCLTHKVCNIEALQIIRENGYHEVACILEKNINSLQLGVTWADLEFKNINHFFNPITRKGLWRFSPAVYDFSVYLTKACRFVKNKDLVNGFFTWVHLHIYYKIWLCRITFVVIYLMDIKSLKIGCKHITTSLARCRSN